MRHPGRWAGAVVVAVLAAMLVNSFVQNPQYHWRTQWHYIFTRPILDGVVTTLELTVLAMVIGVVGGIALAIARLSPNPILSGASWLYIWVFRGTPVLVQIVMWFDLSYLFPHISIGLPFGPQLVTWNTNSLISNFTAAVLALGLNEAAYMAEIVRAGILSVDEGQTEAASALGMGRSLTMRRVVLPQAMRFIVPPTGNETISMLKTSSLAAFISVSELFQQGQNIISRTYITIPILIMVSIWYLAMTSVLTIGQFYVERHYGRGAYRFAKRATLPERIWRAIRYNRPHDHLAPGGGG
ncbi:MAG TPA: amino acid ABC transporter permease [Mycobacteriales bacterium]|nr:amino acid ABC transporter permease [Mycobacteriales bacterium]